VLINGGQRGFLIGIDPKVLVSLVQAQPVQVARDLTETTGAAATATKSEAGE
jgi:hypothetical protein